MANLMYCPKCKETREVTKKGLDKNGNQLWFCKTCKKRFVGNTADGNTTETRSPKCVIYVNQNLIKSFNDILTIDEAFSIASQYFRELIRENAEVIVEGQKTIIKFTVSTGTKG